MHWKILLNYLASALQVEIGEAQLPLLADSKKRLLAQHP